MLLRVSLTDSFEDRSGSFHAINVPENGPHGPSTRRGAAGGGGLRFPLRLRLVDGIELGAAQLAVMVAVGLVEADDEALVARSFGFTHRIVAVDVGTLERLL